MAFLLLGGDELPLRHLGVVVDGAREGGEGGGDLACGGVVAVVSWLSLLELLGRPD